MSGLDTPDNVRGTVDATALLAIVPGLTSSVTVTITPNTEALWIFGAGGVDPVPVVTGATSGFAYPCLYAPWENPPQERWFSIVCIVAGALDTELTITWGGPPDADWYVVETTGGRFGIDANLAGAIQLVGDTLPPAAVQIGGAYETNLLAVAVDATGALKISGSASSDYAGPPGTSPPADAVQVAGSDGTDLRVLATSKQGVPYAVPSAPNTATDDHPPTEIVYTNIDNQAADTPIVAAPGAGKRVRLFFVSAYADNATALYGVQATNIDTTGSSLCVNGGQPGAPVAPAVLPLTGLPCATNTAVLLIVTAGNAGATVGYTIETV